MKKIIFLIAVFTFAGSVFSPSVKAQDLSLVVSPPRIDIEGKPGETLQQTIKITNNSEDKPLILKAFPIDFVVLDDLGTPVKVTESASGRYLASPWFTLEQSELTLAPKQTTQLVVLINIPKDALPGGHYAGVFFEPVESKGLKQTVSYTSTQVGSLFGITIAGDLKYDALIKDFSTTSSLVEFGPIHFNAVIENQSDTHIRPSSSITIHDMIGRKLADVPLSQINIFPFTSRTLEGIWDNIWGFGRYTATLTSTYGPGLVASRTIYFWIMPYRLIAALAVILLVFLTIMIVVKRHLKSREDHRDEEIEALKRKIVEMENRNR